jgi:two-component system cell cycle sensor histidine kinase/response regulator CckA
MEKGRGRQRKTTGVRVGSTRLEALAAALVESDEVILKATTDAAVYSGLCEVVVRHLGLPLAWVGLVEPGTHGVRVQAAAGTEVGYLDESGFATNGVTPVGGILSRALRTGRAEAIADLAIEPGDSPARVLARRHGFRSSASFPIRTGFMVVGTLQCLSNDPGYFDDQVIALLGRLAAAASTMLVVLEHGRGRHEVEQHLANSEQHRRGLFDLAPVAILVLRPGRTEANDAFLGMFRFRDHAALDAAGVLSILDPRQEHATNELRAALMPGSAELRLLQARGRRTDESTFEMLVERVQVELDGAPSALVFFTDLTALETAEAGSRQSKAHVQAILDNVPVAIISLDLEGIVRSWNPAAERVFGRTAAEAIGQAAPGSQPDFAVIAGMATGKRPHLSGQHVRHVRVDGRAMDLRISTASLTDRNGASAQILAVAEDVTDLTRVEADRTRLATAIDQSSESIVITDPAAHIQYVNPAFERLTGYALAEVSGKNPRILQSGMQNREFYEAMWSILTGGETWRGTFVNRARDGRLFEEEASISPVYDADGKLINYVAVKRDVTREREAERERIRESSRYRQIFTEMLTGLAVHEIICDPEGTPIDYRFLDVNPAFEALTGLRAADIVGRRVREVLPNLEPEWTQRYGRVALTGVPDQFESYNEDLGKYFHVRAYCPSPGQFATIFHDVTELHERTAFAETIISSSGEGVIVYDRDLRYVVWNPAMEQLSGLKAADVIGRRPSDVLPAAMASGIEKAARQVLETGETLTLEFPDAVPSTGRLGWAISTYQPHRNSNGKIIGVIAAVRDFTARHEAEEALRRSEEEFRAIFNGAGDGMLIVSPDGAVLEVNQVLCERLGYSRDELLAMPVDAINAPASAAEVPGRLRRILRDGELTHEAVHVRRDGTTIPTEIVARRMEFRGHPAILSVVRDITERKRAEKALGLSEARYRAILDQAPIAVVVSHDGQLIEMNDSGRRMLLLTPDDEISGRSLLDFIAPEFRSEVADMSRRRARDLPAPSAYDTVGLRSDGSRFPMHVAVVRIELPDGPVALGLLADLSEQQRSERDREESQARLRAVMDSTTDPIWSVDPVNFGLLAFNRGFSDLFSKERGFQVKVGDRPEDLFPEDYVQLWRGHYQRALREGSFCVDYVRYSSNYPLELSLNVIGVDGEVLGISVFGKDVTEGRRAEQELRESQARFRDLFDLANDSIFIRELLALSPADLDAPEFAALLPDRTSAIESAGSASFESAHVRKDGTVFPVEISASLIELGGRKAVLSVARDISERKRAEADRTALETQLRQAQKMEGLGQLAGGIAHDFNNLLTAIRGSASLALAELPAGLSAREDLELIEEAADRAASLTGQLLTFARRTVLKPEVVELGAIVRRLQPMLSRLIGEDITFATVTPDGVGYVLADPGQIEQVIVNLAVNARDAMPSGGKLSIEVADIETTWMPDSPEQPASEAPLTTLSVTDTGVGMDDATLGHLFEPFFTTKAPGKGTGLGLATVYGIVHQSGGNITVSTELGKGSRFTVFLPRVVATAAGDMKLSTSTPPKGARTGTVLIAEDDRGDDLVAEAGHAAGRGPSAPAPKPERQARRRRRCRPRGTESQATDVRT